jgi:hypothetical protein
MPRIAFISGSASSALLTMSGDRGAKWLNCWGDVPRDGGEAVGVEEGDEESGEGYKVKGSECSLEVELV